ncbi:MAG: hypothetical protein ACOX8R_11080, partial [Bacillota bacterium]
MKRIRPDQLKRRKKKRAQPLPNGGLSLSFASRETDAGGEGFRSFAVLWGIGTLLLVSVITAAVSCLNLPFYAVAAVLWGVAAMGLSLFFYTRFDSHWRLFFGAVLFTAAVAVLGGEVFYDGLALTLNGVKDLFGMAQSRVFLPAAVSGDYGEALCVTVFLLPVTLILAVVVSYILRAKGRLILFFLAAAVFFLLVTALSAPVWPSCAGLFSGFILAFLARDTDAASRSTAALPVAAAVICIVSLAAVSLPAVGVLSGSEPPKAFAAAERGFASLGDFIRWGRDHTNNLPEGNLKNLPAAERKDRAALDVTMSEWESLY